MNHAPLILTLAALTLAACRPARETLRENSHTETSRADTLTRRAVTDLSGSKASGEALRETIRDTTRQQTWHSRDTTFVLRVKTITRERKILARDTITLLRHDTIREASRSATDTRAGHQQTVTRENRPTVLERASLIVSTIIRIIFLLALIGSLAGLYRCLIIKRR